MAIAVRGASAARLALPVVAVAALAVESELRIPVGLPGHRGLLWLSVLVAVALIARPRGTATAVGAASSLVAIGLGTDPTTALRYAAAAVLLDAALSVPAVRRHPVLLALVAAPVHLVALATTVLHGTGVATLGDKALFHLGFGLVAGSTGWGLWKLTAGRRKTDL
ncbi:MAG: hypothetical protein J0I49_28095 [Pseudonocardia sp.]|uniref:hypothetical protein n=1 Tax=Pseudonocardia sp. TaxID=60912 RepID=UPI001ACFDD96|nr:hypothetical protein [Pseudonocardia sp.]MBN9101929.1 hypothetical protein [Pseudonocardia sp.]